MPPESDDSLQLLTATRVVVVAGKGGVGKTTVTAVIARAAARAGARVLAVELDGKPTLARLLADGGVEVLPLAAATALEEYLQEHGFGRIAKRLNKSGIIDLMGTAAPGIDDVVVLGKVKQLSRSGDYDVIVVDGPAAGHAVTFLTSASGLADAMPGGPVHVQASAVQQMLRDHEYLQVVLVTLPETTPVNEAIETAEVFRDRVGVRLGPVVVNGLDDGPPLPDEGAQTVALAGIDEETAGVLAEAAAFVRERRDMESTELARLRRELVAPLGLAEVDLPTEPTAELSTAGIDRLADVLSRPPAVRPDPERASAATAEVATGDEPDRHDDGRDDDLGDGRGRDDDPGAVRGRDGDDPDGRGHDGRDQDVDDRYGGPEADRPVAPDGDGPPPGDDGGTDGEVDRGADREDVP